MDPRRSVSPAAILPDIDDLVDQPCIGEIPVARAPPAPVVVAGFGDVQSVAHAIDVELVTV